MPSSQPPESRPEGFSIRGAVIGGFGIGVLIATTVFVIFALLPGTSRPLGLYVGLAGVLGVSVGLLVAIGLVGWRALRLTREP